MQAIDHARHNEIEKNLYRMLINLTNVAIAEKLESERREALSGKPDLIEDAKLFLDRTPNEIDDGFAGQFVRVSYAGETPLTHVLVVTRLDMKPLDEQDQETREFVHGINELFGAGERRVGAADWYVATTQVLYATPQATLAYFPVLKPGDVAYVPLYDLDEYWNLAEARASFYSDQGMVRDQVLFRGGPHNDTTLSPEERDRLIPKEPRLELDYPPMPRGEKVEVTLRQKPGAEPFEYDVCIPAGKSYLRTGEKVTAGDLRITEVVAADKSTYIAIGPERHVGRCLMMVPKRQVSRRTVTDIRGEDAKRQARQR